MLKNKSIALIIAVLFLLPAAVFASVAGSLDKRFDTDGKLTFLSGFGSTFYDAAVQQADGKIVAVGNCNPTLTTSDFLVVRFNADGSLDTSFDSDGIVTTDFGGGNNFAYSVKILANGKILVAGSAVVTGTGQDFALARYNLNGSLDTNFDADGKLTTDFGATTYEAGAEIMIQSDGKYVLAGRALTAGADYAAARYNIDGSLDTTFDSDGKTVIQLTADFDILTAAALQNNDKIILAGSSGSDFCLVRLNSNGALDPNFDTDGIVTTDFAGLGDTLNGVAIQSDGRIVACGAITQVGNDRDFGCARYSQNGSLHNGFGTGGKITTAFGTASTDLANDVVIQPDGKVVVGGQTNQNGGNDFALVRYKADGTPDATFDGDGKVLTEINGSADGINSMLLQSDGRIIAGGAASQGTVSAALTRYNPRTFNVAFDFDGDDKTDVGIFRPSVGEWWYSRSTDNQVLAAQFGDSNDKIVPGDFTGDGRSDIAFFRPVSGFWFILRSEDGSFFSFPFGATGDIPVPADYDGDGKTDPAVFRPSNVTWFISRSSDGGTTIATFGASGDKPVPADYDGDGRSDIAIFRPSVGEWWYSRSSTGQTAALQFGLSTDRPVPADYTGDGKADIAFFRPSTGFWFILRSEDFSFFSFPFGATGDTPVPGDYDGDGRIDTAVFRQPVNTWFLNRTSAGVLITNFGASGDQPIPTAFIP